MWQPATRLGMCGPRRPDFYGVLPGRGSASVVAAIRVGGHFGRASGRYPDV
jgi:hypothetical protein